MAAAAPVVTTASVAEPTAKTSLARASSAQVVAQTVARSVAGTAKPTLLQRIAINKVTKQVAKAEARQQDTASTAHAAAAGTSIKVALVGLAALIIGIIVSSGFLITAGAVVLVVGVALFIIKAL